jgi:predicted nucleic acid-binding protein
MFAECNGYHTLSVTTGMRRLEIVSPATAQTRRLFVEELVSLVPVHPVTKQTGWLVGQIEGQEAAKGNVLPFNDLMIAAAALEQGYAVLTTNLRHFQKIPNLTVIPF